MLSGKTRVSLLTPTARGAIAVIRVWGDGAVSLADRVFRPASGPCLSDSKPGTIRFGRAGAGAGDEVVAVVVGKEFPEVELHTHGGPAAVRWVLDALVAEGAEVRKPSAWVKNHSRSVIESEARVDLAQSPTLRTAEILLDQANGALEQAIRGLLDYVHNDPDLAKPAIEALLNRATVGLRLITGWRVVLAGRPNVGKSRLLNALAGFDRAIVASTPGTTRDVVTSRVSLEGWPVELSDTAGLRRATDEVEASGVELARIKQADADVLILVLDHSEPLTAVDRALTESLIPALTVANKSDLPRARTFSASTDVAVSAEHGDGIDRLIERLSLRLVPLAPAPMAAVPFRKRHVEKLTSCLDAIDRGDRPAAVESLSQILSGTAHERLR